MSLYFEISLILYAKSVHIQFVMPNNCYINEIKIKSLKLPMVENSYIIVRALYTSIFECGAKSRWKNYY